MNISSVNNNLLLKLDANKVTNTAVVADSSYSLIYTNSCLLSVERNGFGALIMFSNWSTKTEFFNTLGITFSVANKTISFTNTAGKGALSVIAISL